jgi:hypothetical protein
MLKKIMVALLAIAPVSVLAASSLPEVCTDWTGSGTPKKIYSDAALKKSTKFTSSNALFTPKKEINKNGMDVYQGAVTRKSNNHPAVGKFYIDVKEWTDECKAKAN